MRCAGIGNRATEELAVVVTTSHRLYRVVVSAHDGTIAFAVSGRSHRAQEERVADMLVFIPFKQADDAACRYSAQSVDITGKGTAINRRDIVAVRV